MKKLFYVFSISILFISCQKQTVDTDDRPIDQKRFLSLLFDVKPKYDANEIVANEFNASKNDTLNNEFANRVVFNWQGKIKDISIYEESGYSIVSVEIELSHNEFNTINLKSDYQIKDENKKTDSLFNSIKRLSKLSKVYFDGIFYTNADSKLFIQEDIIENMYSSFKLLRISENKLNPVSKNLYDAMSFNYTVFDKIKEKSEKKISSNQYEKDLKAMFSKIDTLKLNSHEKYINDLHKKYLYSFFIGS